MYCCWDPNFPLENTKPPTPRILEKLLKNYNLSNPWTVLEITEKLLKITKITKYRKITKKLHF